ncbi:MAG TPA: alpha/beta hydrolase [Rhizomicrobium sp.]|jgi:acetyl esterase/lipase
MLKRLFALLFALGCSAAAFLPLTASGSPSYKELLARPRNTPDQHIAYGKAPQQFGELYLPKGKGPFKVVAIIHGGCWLAELPGPELMDPMAGVLRDRGYAVWSIDYRRIGHPGGGYPGTFDDAGRAIDMLRGLGPKYRLDLGHVVLVGHSAGGHLALWAAARARLPANSVLRHPDPLPVRGVVSLSGIPDLAAYRASGAEACGGPGTIDSLVGKHADPYADTAPIALLPLGVKQAIVSGQTDRIVAAHFGHDYAAKAKAAGDTVEDIEVPAAGHFDLIDPQAPAWKTVLGAIDAQMK